MAWPICKGNVPQIFTLRGEITENLPKATSLGRESNPGLQNEVCEGQPPHHHCRSKDYININAMVYLKIKYVNQPFLFTTGVKKFVLSGMFLAFL